MDTKFQNQGLPPVIPRTDPPVPPPAEASSPPAEPVPLPKVTDVGVVKPEAVTAPQTQMPPAPAAAKAEEPHPLFEKPVIVTPEQKEEGKRQKEEGSGHKLPKGIIAGIAALVFLVAGLGGGAYLIQQRQYLEAQAKYGQTPMTIANLADRSLSVRWTSIERAKGCVTISLNDGSNPKQVCDNSKNRAHLINIDGLIPNTTYKIVARAGKQENGLSDFFSGVISTRDAKANRSPRYIKGKIIYSDQSPAARHLVFIYPNLTDRIYYPFAAITDGAGNYRIDISLEDFQYTPPDTEYLIEVNDQNGNVLVENKQVAFPPGTLVVENTK